MGNQSKMAIFQNDEKPGSCDMTIFGKMLLCNGKYHIQTPITSNLVIQIKKHIHFGKLWKALNKSF